MKSWIRKTYFDQSHANVVTLSYSTFQVLAQSPGLLKLLWILMVSKAV